MSGFTSEFLDKPDKGSFVVFHPGHTHTHTDLTCGWDESTWREHENGQNNIRTERHQLAVVSTLSLADHIISDVITQRRSAWEKTFSGMEELFEELRPSKTWYDFTQLIIKRPPIHQVLLCFYLFYLFPPFCTSSHRTSCLLSSILAPGWISSPFFSFFLFCSFWHPTKLIASEGIGAEGPVLFWQFFQERPSIRWSIVLETDLSLLNSRLCCEKQMLQRYWEFAGYITAAPASPNHRAAGQRAS